MGVHKIRCSAVDNDSLFVVLFVEIERMLNLGFVIAQSGLNVLDRRSLGITGR